MRRNLRFLLFLLLICTGWHNRVVAASYLFIQRDTINHKQTPKYVLTDNDRKTYVLTINQADIGLPHDTLVKGKNCRIIWLPVSIANNSGQTLSYLSFWYRWCFPFRTDRQSIGIMDTSGLHDSIEFSGIRAHETIVEKIPLIFEKGALTGNNKFRIGLNVQWFFGKKLPWKTEFRDFSGTTNIIWSNEVMMPN